MTKMACLMTIGQDMKHFMMVSFLVSYFIICNRNFRTKCSPLLSKFLSKCYLMVMVYSDIIIDTRWLVWSEKKNGSRYKNMLTYICWKCIELEMRVKYWNHVNEVGSIKLTVYKIYGTHTQWSRQWLWKISKSDFFVN